jgi:hypothetical protein
MGNSPLRYGSHPRPRGRKCTVSIPTNTHGEPCSPIPVPVVEFILAGNLSRLENAVFRCKFKLVILKQYNLNKQDLEIEETHVLEFSLLFYTQTVRDIVYCGPLFSVHIH